MSIWHELKHFRRSEFTCPCCNDARMNSVLLRYLENIRETSDVTMVVTSGWRCTHHNQYVGGAHESAHLFGRAADIQMPEWGLDRFKLVRAALLVLAPEGYSVQLGLYKRHLHIGLTRCLTYRHEHTLWID